MNKNAKALHVMKALTATALAAYGFKQGGVVGGAVGIVGAGLTATELAAAAGLPLTPAQREARQTIEVTASPEDAYRMWSRFEEFPRFMDNVVEVRRTGDRSLSWVVEGSLGQRTQWDARVTADEPGKLIAWRSTTPGIDSGGEVRFERTQQGTRILAVMTFGESVGPIAAVVAKVTRREPQQLVRRDLRRFKRLIEAREARGFWREGSRQHLDDAQARKVTA
jgi:uncharacterized membrane protein